MSTENLKVGDLVLAKPTDFGKEIGFEVRGTVTALVFGLVCIEYRPRGCRKTRFYYAKREDVVSRTQEERC